MVTPGSFIEVRRDGRLVPETTTLNDMLAAGIEPDKIVALHWDHAGRPISLRTAFALMAEIAPNRAYVAVVESLDETDNRSPVTKGREWTT